MAAPAPTIVELKSAFLREQVRTLSTPLQVPNELPLVQDLASEDRAIPSPSVKIIDQVVHKVNHSLKRHNRLVYGPRALRHVAEQIDRLYIDKIDSPFAGNGEAWAERTTDYTSDDVIIQLPDIWNEHEAGEGALKQYQELKAHLVELSARRKFFRERLEMCKSLKAVTQHLESKEGVQENLITRNGEMELELEKMRRLMVRVERGVIGLVENNSEGE